MKRFVFMCTLLCVFALVGVTATEGHPVELYELRQRLFRRPAAFFYRNFIYITRILGH
jgi:hypothetical protein